MAKKDKKTRANQPVVNKRASFDYYLDEELIVGLVLNGPETRAARDGHVQLKGSYVNIKDNELWLVNASFSLKLNQKNEPSNRTVDTTSRKLLASRQQINNLASRKKAGFSIVPVRLLNNKRYIKLVIALGRGKKLYDKRDVKKRRGLEREEGRKL